MRRTTRDDREVWLDGQRVHDVTSHPAIKGMVQELARVYDLQNSGQYRDEMTFVDPDSGLRTSLSWLMPRSAEDWKLKRRNSELWNELTWGQLGRSPDILAPFIVGLAQRVDELSAVKYERDGLRTRLRSAEHNLKVATTGDTQRIIDAEVRKALDKLMRQAPDSPKASV